MYLYCLEPGHYRDASGRVLDRAALARLAASQQGSPVLVLPQQLCFVAELPVQPAELRHLPRTLPWRFEEQLIEPVEALHFAHSPVVEGRVRVTALRRDWLRAVLDDLASSGLLPRTALAECELLPWREQEWTIQIPGGSNAAKHAVVRHGWHRALVCDQDNIAAVVQALADEAAALPRRILICSQGKVAEAWRDRLPGVMQGLVEFVAPAEAPLPPLCCNVLQGEFSPRLPWARWWREWRLAAVLLLGVFLAQAGFTAASAFQLARANAALRASIDAAVAEALPGATIVDPLLQLRRAVVAAGGEEGTGLLPLLTRVAPLVAGNSALRVQGLEYDQASGELQLLLESNGFAVVENLRSSLQAQGLQAELLGSTSDGNLSRSRLRIRA